MSHFQPISLCNTFYKIITKIMVNPMQPVLGHIVQPTQSAFVLHREIHDNILLAHEVMNNFQHMKG